MEIMIFRVLLVLFIVIFISINIKFFLHYELMKNAKDVKNNVFKILLIPTSNIVAWFTLILPIYPDKKYSQLKNYRLTKNLVTVIYMSIIMIVILFIIVEATQKK